MTHPAAGQVAGLRLWVPRVSTRGAVSCLARLGSIHRLLYPAKARGRA
ncbi:hypothetical protein [Streptomyces sp. NPDC002889]